MTGFERDRCHGCACKSNTSDASTTALILYKLFTWCGNAFGVGVLLAMLLAAESIAAHAQMMGHPAESPAMQQLHHAVSLAEHGDRQGAMSIALRLLEQHPDFVPAIKLKGMLLEESGRASEAEAVYEEALKLAPNDADLLLKIGIYKLSAGQKEEAIKLLLHCARIQPGDGDTQFYLAQAYHLNGQDELALRAIRQSVKAEPDNASVLQKYGELLCSTGDYAGGLRWLHSAEESDSTLPLLDYDIGWANYNLMDFTNAVKYSTRAVEIHPNDINALRLLASAQLKLERWQDAKGSFERMLVFKQGDADALLGLGHCELELKNYQDAAEQLEAVLRLDPTQLLAHFYLSRAYAAMGRVADAQREAALHHLMMEQVTFVRSAESEASENAIKSQARQLLKEHDEGAALQLFQEHSKGTSATLGDAYVFIGKLYLFMGDTADGLRNLHYALKIEPTVRGAHTNEGILALKEGDLSKAEREFKAELANDPNYQTAIAELGEVRYHQERWSEAAEQLEKSRTMTPELLYMLCDAYFHLGKAQDADLTAELVAAYGRNNQELMQGLLQMLRRNGQSDLAQRLSANIKP